MISNPKGDMDYELGGGVYAAPSGWRVAPPPSRPPVPAPIYDLKRNLHFSIL